jgi:hypothetical protein
MKRCCTCKLEKPGTTEFFPRDASRKDGLQPRCKACFKAYRETNRERVNAKVAELTAANKARYAVKHKQWRDARKAEAVARAKVWASAHKDDPHVKAMRLESSRRWRAANSVRNVAKSKNYYLRREQRIPVWVDEDALWIIDEAVALARLREQLVGGSWHVDHIVPLHGRVVSGLHSPDNIQVVPAQYNMYKGSRFDINAGPIRYFG